MTNSLIQDFYQNLRAGFRLMTFQKVRLWDFRFHVDQLMLLIGLDLLISVVGDYFVALPNPRFYRYAIPAYTFGWMLPFIAAFFISKWIKKDEIILQILTLLLIYSPVITIINQCLNVFDLYPDKLSSKINNWLFHGYSFYLIILLWRIFYLISNNRKLVPLLGVIFLYVITEINHHYFTNYRFWYAKPDYTEEKNYYAEYEKLDAEALMYKQQPMLDKALAELKPQRKKHSDIYFVGFAPYAMEDVFYKEITYAKNLMDKRFDTQGHSINLINHLKTTDKLPLATGINLASTLKRIGQLMDKDEDVLVLYLTSHGSREHELSVNFYPLALNDLTPAKLKTMLDEAGIKWRVVIVSACYSGGYIKPLENANTVVASAAAADKTSFGCGNEFDFTYFGQAFFKDQLNKQTSLISALKQADIEIGKREVREKKEPSKPQLSVGADIEKKLNSLEKTVVAYQCGKNYQVATSC